MRGKPTPARDKLSNSSLWIFLWWKHKICIWVGGRYCCWLVDAIRHLRNEKESGAEMCSIHGSGIVTGDALVDLISCPSYCWLVESIIILVIIIIITLFESQIILAEHECCTNWGDCKSNKSNQIKCWFLRRGENRSSRRKTSRSRVENQQTQPTYDAGSGNRTWDTLVEGERSHHYTNPAPKIVKRFWASILFRDRFQAPIGWRLDSTIHWKQIYPSG